MELGQEKGEVASGSGREPVPAEAEAKSQPRERSVGVNLTTITSLKVLIYLPLRHSWQFSDLYDLAVASPFHEKTCGDEGCSLSFTTSRDKQLSLARTTIPVNYHYGAPFR